MNWNHLRKTIVLIATSMALLAATGSAVAAVPCTELDLLTAVEAANSSGGGTITFACENTTIPMQAGLGDILDNVVIDGENRNITLEFVTNFSGCSQGNNGIGAPAIGTIRGSGNVIRNLTFKNYLESLQIVGPNNTIESNVFQAHNCSDDGLSSPSVEAVGMVVRSNEFFDYKDKAFQMSYGGGVVEMNSFVDCNQPIRSPYDNTFGEPFFIRNNNFSVTDDITACAGVSIDGIYVIEYEGNFHQCRRGLRIAGDTEIIIRNSVFEGNERVGVLVYGNAVASLEGNTIINNGIASGAQPSGGVVIYENGTADLGGGTSVIGGWTVHSQGNNMLRGNGPEPNFDARNLNLGVPMEAESNCWDGQDAATIAGDVDGDVDFTNFHHSMAEELCDGIDNDCNGVVDDDCTSEPEPGCGDGTLDPTEACDLANLGGQSCLSQGFDGGTLSCAPSCTLDASECFCIDDDGDGVALCDGDCDDTNPDAYPGATEVCNDGIDQDCNGKDKTKGCKGGGRNGGGGGGGDTGNEQCKNGVDDDGDGLVDCADSDCARKGFCR